MLTYVLAVLELPATLILATRVFGNRMHRRERGPAAAMTAGLAGMLSAESGQQAEEQHPVREGKR